MATKQTTLDFPSRISGILSISILKHSGDEGKNKP